MLQFLLGNITKYEMLSSDETLKVFANHITRDSTWKSSSHTSVVLSANNQLNKQKIKVVIKCGGKF